MEDSKLRLYSRARLSRDARFDGVFFTAVKTTGIYCRPICPATPPLEKNVEYHHSAISAADSGFRPCLRCRPDSAPESCAWLGSETSFQRAFKLINQGVLQDHSLPELAERLGISDRYLRVLFQTHLGTSPKKYANYQQCLFAKKLLHESSLAIADVAFAAGFNSVRRFNEVFKAELGLAPRDIRKKIKPSTGVITIFLSYRPPYAWSLLHVFLQRRLIEGVEWAEDHSYCRTISFRDSKGYFKVSADEVKNRLKFEIFLDSSKHLNQIVSKLRCLFDLDAPIHQIDQHLSSQVGEFIDYQEGLRVPGIWGCFEAGVRAVLGQQVSVGAAKKLVTTMVVELGEEIILQDGSVKRLFPKPESVARSNLAFFRMPQSRKDTIHRLADHFINDDDPDNIDRWLELKGIGPWTVNYVKLRASKDPDIWLAGDAGLKNAIKAVGKEPNLDSSRPWRSYLTMQMWNQL